MKQIFFRAPNEKTAKIFGNLGTVQKLFPGALGDLGRQWCLTIGEDEKVENAMTALKANTDIQYVELAPERKLVRPINH